MQDELSRRCRRKDQRMSATSEMERSDATWNPVTGCTKISPGCKHCYAELMAERLQAMGQPKYRNGFSLTLHESVLDAPLHRKRPQMIFVNSMQRPLSQRCAHRIHSARI